ncbi:MAG: AzlD domain-containing protein [Synergistaceae bacterium]|nr:AzlD domain-containing protein [Synergistaceae bacterium]
MRSEIFFIIAGMAIVTFATRFASVALLGQKKMPAGLERGLRHIPTGILTALIVPTLLLPEGYVDLSLHNHYLLAGLVAAVVAWKSHSMVGTLILGMGTMFLLRLLS